MKYALWVLQILLALLFVFTGVVKLVLPGEQMTIAGGMILMELFPFVLGIFCSYIAYARWRLVPLHGRRG